MRKIMYELSNGTMCANWIEAKNSGLTFKEKMVTVRDEMPERSPKRQAQIDNYGFVRP